MYLMATKTVRRKMAEAALYVWGITGLIICFMLARQALEIDWSALTFQGRQPQATFPVMMYTLIWIGGLVFTGFFAALSPVTFALRGDTPNVGTDRELLPAAVAPPIGA